MLRTRLQQGHRTLRLPAELPACYHGRLLVDPRACEAGCRACEAACPTGAIALDPLRVDLGACVFCARCVDACGKGALRRGNDSRLATSRRDALILDGGEMKLASALEGRLRRMLGRSLRLRQVSAGGCNGCEAELNVSGNVAFDLPRFGVQFVASPRHADAVVVTGPVTANMRQALLDTYEAMPSPRLVIAVGACAISGGAFAGSPRVAGLPKDLPVDLFVPGCPPHPLTFIDGVLRLLGRAG